MMLLALAAMMAYFSGALHPKLGMPEGGEGGAVITSIKRRYEGELVHATLQVVPAFERVAGTIQATNDTLIASRIMANIVRISVRAGDSVARQQLLVELDDEALVTARQQRSQQAAAAQVVWEEAKLTRDRTQSLRASGSVSQSAMDRAATAERRSAAELEQARRAVAEANTAIEYARIRAPMSGTIVERFAEPGDIASPGQALLKLFNPGQMRIEATVRESLIGYVKLGDELDATIDAQDRTTKAIIEEIVPSADPTSRTFLLKARLGDIDGLFPGMFARLAIPLVSEAPRVWVPLSAVQRAGQLRFVYVREEQSDTRRFVRLGQQLVQQPENLVEIRSGLTGTETLVLPLSIVPSSLEEQRHGK
jgi:RND family efflux transporter MFP subunit